jgi:hypothetical protein
LNFGATIFVITGYPFPFGKLVGLRRCDGDPITNLASKRHAPVTTSSSRVIL